MMHTAPAAPSAPPSVARISPPVLNPDSPPCADRPPIGISTAIRKYATPTHSSALSGLPSCTWPCCRNTPYAPHDRTAPATKITHPIDFLLCVVLCVCVVVIGSRLGARLSNASRAPGSRASRGTTCEFGPFFACGAGLIGACLHFSDTLLARAIVTHTRRTDEVQH